MSTARSDHPHEAISAYLDGELADEERGAVEHHLDRCPDCARLRDDLTRLAEVSRDESVPPVPEDLGARIAARLDRARPRRPWFLRMPMAAAASLMAAGLLWVAWQAGSTQQKNVAREAGDQLAELQEQNEQGQSLEEAEPSPQDAEEKEAPSGVKGASGAGQPSERTVEANRLRDAAAQVANGRSALDRPERNADHADVGEPSRENAPAFQSEYASGQPLMGREYADKLESSSAPSSAVSEGAEPADSEGSRRIAAHRPPPSEAKKIAGTDTGDAAGERPKSKASDEADTLTPPPVAALGGARGETGADDKRALEETERLREEMEERQRIAVHRAAPAAAPASAQPVVVSSDLVDRPDDDGAAAAVGYEIDRAGRRTLLLRAPGYEIDLTETGELSLRSGDYRCSVSAADLPGFADAETVAGGEPRQKRPAGPDAAEIAAIFAASDELALARASEARGDVQRMAAKDGSRSSLLLRQDGLAAVPLSDQTDVGKSQQAGELEARILALVEDSYREALESRCGALPLPLAQRP